MKYTINTIADYQRYFLTQVLYITPDKSKVSINPNLSLEALQEAVESLNQKHGETFIQACNELEMDYEATNKALIKKLKRDYKYIAKVSFESDGMEDDNDLLSKIDETLNILKNNLNFKFKKAPKVKFTMLTNEYKGMFDPSFNEITVNMAKIGSDSDACITLAHELTHKWDKEKSIGFNEDGSLGELENPLVVVAHNDDDVKKLEKIRRKYNKSIAHSLFDDYVPAKAQDFMEQKILAEAMIKEYERTTFYKANPNQSYVNMRGEILTRFAEVFVYNRLNRPEGVEVQLLQDKVAKITDTQKLENDAWVINNLGDHAYEQLKSKYPDCKNITEIKIKINEAYKAGVKQDKNLVVSEGEKAHILEKFDLMFSKYVELLNNR